jgi:hypothetical protein
MILGQMNHTHFIPRKSTPQEKLEYMKPAEAAHYNFRNLPLEIFDHAPDFEVKTPQEWMKEAMESQKLGQIWVTHLC